MSSIQTLEDPVPEKLELPQIVRTLITSTGTDMHCIV